MMNDILVLYHGDSCLDGHASASVAYRYLTQHRSTGPQVHAVAVSYGEAIPCMKDKDVYILDFSYRPAELIEAAKEAGSVTLLDHHISAKEQWDKYAADTSAVSPICVRAKDGSTITHYQQGNVHAYFASHMSGSVLTYRFFYRGPTACWLEDMLQWDDGHTPLLLKYCQDWDLHTLQLPHVKDIVSALYTKSWIREQNFHAFNDLVDSVQFGEFARLGEVSLSGIPAENSLPVDSNAALAELLRSGVIIQQYQVDLVNAMIARGQHFVTLCGHVVPAMHCPRELRTIAGGVMAKGHPFSITYEDRHDNGTREYSFRSDKDDPNAVDVKALAVSLGGGGHKHASGVKMPIDAVAIWNIPGQAYTVGAINGIHHGVAQPVLQLQYKNLLGHLPHTEIHFAKIEGTTEIRID